MPPVSRLTPPRQTLPELLFRRRSDPSHCLPANCLLLGLATRLTDGYAAAAPTLTAALRAYLAEERHLDWSWVAYSLAAMDLWDDDAWLELASSQAELARATGTLILLPFALDYLAIVSYPGRRPVPGVCP